MHSQDQVAPHDRRCGHLGPYGLSPISPPREPHPMARGGRCVASRKHLPESKWVSQPISAGPAPEHTHHYIAPLTGSPPMAQATPVPGDGRCGPGRAPSLPPAGASATRHMIGVATVSRGRSRTVGGQSASNAVPEQRPAGGALRQACARCTRSIQSCFSSVPATAMRRSSETASRPAMSSMRARARAATSVTRSATSLTTS